MSKEKYMPNLSIYVGLPWLALKACSLSSISFDVSRKSLMEGSGLCRQIALFILLLSRAQLEMPTIPIGGSTSM
jgi:hypothetical protein